MSDERLETVTILAKLISKARVFDNGQIGKVVAVPVAEITEVLEQFTTTQTQPPIKPRRRS